MRMRVLGGTLLGLAMLGVLADTALAQNAQIVGLVRDNTGGVMPGVVVTARNQETGLTRTATTDANGEYRLPALPPGVYTLTAEIQGFTAETRRDIVLVIDQTATINITLRPAALQETVTVTGEPPVVDTTASSVATSVSNEQIQELPVASRRWIDLAMLTPGTSQDNIRGFFYRGNVNVGAGTREYSNAFIVDGVNNTWAEMGEPRQNFAMDSIREFKVTTSNYKAEYGLATGGLVTVVSKSGTNELHGSGFLFFRDRSLTARTVFERERPPFRRYQYGGTIGGPIVKDRTHYFYAYERTDENQFFTVNTGKIWPDYEGTYPSEQYRWNYTAKVDHQLGPTQSVFLRWAQEDEYRPIITAGGRVTPSASFDFAVPRHSLVVAHTWVISDRALNDFRFQNAFSKYEVAPPYSHGSWDPGYFGEDRLRYCTPVFNYPSVQIGGCGNTQMGPEGRWQFKNDFSYLVTDWAGTHQWKTGVDYNYITFEADGGFNPLGTWTFPKDAPYNPNDRSTWPTQFTSGLPTYADIPVHHFSVYLQDDWQPTRNLTFNLGLRYDLQVGVFNEDVPALLARIQRKLGRDGQFPVPIPESITEGYRGRGDRNNFGPRIGFAWDPTGSGTTNVRAAYGMFYDNIRTLTNFAELTWPQSKLIVISNPSFPDPFQGRSREQFFSLGTPNITVGSSDYVNPYAHQFNVGLSRMLTRDIAATVDFTYVDRYADRDTIDINLPDPVTRQRPYPQFNRVSVWRSTADNTYRALLVKVEKRLTNNYQFLASYTLSYAKDDNFVNSLGDRYGYHKIERYGAADRRHRLVVSGIVLLPGQLLLSAIGDFRSDLPFSPTTGLDLNRDGYTGDLPAGVLPNSGCRGLNLDAVNAFRAGRGLTPVSEVECPGFANIDLRLSKSFTVLGSHRFELIAQLFNVFNRPNYNAPSGGGSSLTSGNDARGRPLFGQPTTLLPNINAPSRQVEFAVRYQF
ncbi:MAG TPA: carboxypeptidase regulatory-like domain-containing protein [Vicinamibacterales bacterium]|nr:carboxypeptidase regulatory-like domain-containing protein [Vicinamibacterales bacterium]